MEDTDRRKLDKFERQQAFFTDNAADFPAGTPGGDVAAANAAIVSELNSLAGEQFSEAGASQQATDDKTDLVERLVQILRNINRAANAFEDEIPGSDQQFRLPRNRSEINLLAAGRSFHEDATPLKPRFIEYGLDANFLDELTALITGIEAAGQRGDSSGEQRAASTAGIKDAAERGMANSRRADAIVRIKYANNPQKLAAWTVASHLERAPKKKESPQPVG